MVEWSRAAITEALAHLSNLQPLLFGSEQHKFMLNPTVGEERVRAFEQKILIRLPADYRDFVVKVGNGGAGPFYGVFPLGFVDENFGIREWHANDGLVGDPGAAFPHLTAWNEIAEKPPDELQGADETEYWRLIVEFEKAYWTPALVNGAIPICHEGCAIRIWLVVTGPQAGRLWEDRRSEFKGLAPLSLADGSPATFRSWYEEWLDHALNRL